MIAAGLRTKKLDEEEAESVSNEPKTSSPSSPQMLISEPNHKNSKKITTVPELELRKLERGELSLKVLLIFVSSTQCLNSWLSCMFADFYLSSLSQLHSAEMQEQLLSCLNSDHYSNWEPWDKKVI